MVKSSHSENVSPTASPFPNSTTAHPMLSYTHNGETNKIRDYLMGSSVQDPSLSPTKVRPSQRRFMRLQRDLIASEWSNWILEYSSEQKLRLHYRVTVILLADHISSTVLKAVIETNHLSLVTSVVLLYHQKTCTS